MKFLFAKSSFVPKQVLIDFNSERSRDRLMQYLTNSWELNSKTICTIFEKHSGQIMRYSTEHATLMLELFDEHFKDLSYAQKLGYITSKKERYKYLANNSALEFFVTFFASVFTSVFVSNNLPTITPFEIFVVFFLVVTVIFIITLNKLSRRHTFYSELLMNLDNYLDNKSSNAVY